MARSRTSAPTRSRPSSAPERSIGRRFIRALAAVLVLLMVAFVVGQAMLASGVETETRYLIAGGVAITLAVLAGAATSRDGRR